MHPLNDVREGDALVKLVYETLRGAPDIWSTTMLIITFDEHGGFFDHVPPPATVPTGDDHRYGDGSIPFGFDQLGVRVPAVVVSPYTQKGTIIGTPGDGISYDHSSVAATLRKRLGFAPLTGRDAQAPTLEFAVNLATPRDDAPMKLPDKAPDSALGAAAGPALTTGLRDYAPLSDNQRSFLALALACDLEVTDISQHQSVRTQYQGITTQKQATDYIQSVEQKLSPAQSAGG
jgi:phospholipase C